MFEEILDDSFKRNFEFEITNVLKNDSADFEWIKTPSLEEEKRIKAHKISFSNEIMDVNFASTEKLSEDDKAKKNVVVLIAKNLNKTNSIEMLEKGIKSYMGVGNVIGTFFRLKKEKHVSTYNVQCLNVAVYEKHIKQSAKILHKWVEFAPYPKNLDGMNAPSEAELVRLRFTDVNTTLTNTI